MSAARESSMSIFGLCCLAAKGHLHPMMALARCLNERGHRTIFFLEPSGQALIKTSGFEYSPLWKQPQPPALLSAAARKEAARMEFADELARHALRVLDHAPEGVRRAGVDALLVDETDLAAGSVAELLDIPFVNIGLLPPLRLAEDVPPFNRSWQPRDGIVARLRNRLANRTLARRVLGPAITLINSRRRIWGMAPFRHVNEVFSKLACISQLPKSFDFPRVQTALPLFYAGPFTSSGARRTSTFPWERLNRKPLIYASMGTVRNTVATVYRTIASACAPFDFQLVLSLGGGMEPKDLGTLPGDPIVVFFAPQLELLQRAALTITHAGINTTLESLGQGVPIVAIPVTDDQPGVAARIRRCGAGRVVPAGTLSTKELQIAILDVLKQGAYRARAQSFQMGMQIASGAARAATVIESVLSGRSLVISEEL